MGAGGDTEIHRCTDAAQWESWLADHYEHSNGIWLLIGKKGSEATALKIGEALDVALCYGWIDSQRKGYDANHFLQRYSPRRGKSPWSKLNVQRAEALINAGRMHISGFAEIEAAKADGRWAVAYEPQREFKLPPEFIAALEESARAQTAFERLDKTGQYAIVLPILKATTPAFLRNRIRKAIDKLEASV